MSEAHACEVGTHDRIRRIRGQGEARKARRLGRADARRVRTEKVRIRNKADVRMPPGTGARAHLLL